VFGAAVLCAPPLLLHAGSGHPPPAGPYLPWAAVVTVVAIAEESFLRGALFDAIQARYSGPGDRPAGTTIALAITSLCFAALHVPLYGWQTLPLNLAVGLWLGALRQAAGGWTAPAITHVLADLAGWWLH
jgi:membrane protease YdiL (CAAX protease family)